MISHRVNRVTRSLAALAFGGLLALAACSSTEAPVSKLDPSDLNPTADESPFTPDASLVPDLDFTDPAAIREISAVQRFFEHSPYNNRSFLSTYSSNGTTAAGAVLSAALKYDINPIVLLTRLQMAEGLISAADYPTPSTRVEYVFQCGCDGQGVTCVPEMAGLDRQLECMAARLTDYLAQQAQSPEGVTYGGWGVGLTALTLDGIDVTPPDKSSAALYQLDPVYGEKSKAGAWLFFHVYLRYSRAFSYSGSVDPSSRGAWIGEPCESAADCSQDIPGVRCLTEYPNGYCSATCSDDGCPSNSKKAAAYCADLLQSGGGCVIACNPAAPNCRPGYTCAKVPLLDTPGQTADACTKTN